MNARHILHFLHFFAPAACIAMLMQTATVARADVTIVMQGEVELSPTIDLPRSLTNLLYEMLDATMYYHGHFVRLESDLGVDVNDVADGESHVIERQSGRSIYGREPEGPFSLHEYLIAFRRGASGAMGSNITFDYSVVSNHPSTFRGHRCRTYTMKGSLTVDDTGASIGISALEIRAIDFPDIKPPVSTINGVRLVGVPLYVALNLRGPRGDWDFHVQAASISTEKLSPDAFNMHEYVPTVTAEGDSSESSRGVSAKGSSTSLSDVNQDFNAWDSYSEKAGLRKAAALIKANRFSDAEALVRSLTRRGLTSKLPPIYNELGDNAVIDGRNDVAWGWYTLAVEYGTAPADIVKAHFALAKYALGNDDTDDAAKNLQAIIDLPGASPDDVSNATNQLNQITAASASSVTPSAPASP